MAAKNVYATDHAESVLSTHRWRRLDNSASYVVPYLKPGLKVLDVGCGPGSLTVDIAKHVSPDGNVIGIENQPGPLAEGRRLADAEGVNNVTLELGDAHNLAYEDETFDLVHAHQVLQHITNPVKALSEMRRVVKTGGIVACRESATATWYPDIEALMFQHELARRLSKDRGGNPHPGNHIHVWAREAGFSLDQIKRSAGTWCFSTPEERVYWGGTMAARAESSGFASNAIEGGYVTAVQLTTVATAWREWTDNEDAWFGFLHGEIICRK
jgi:ubiquinone/menaquinone biosynthesis C-methylase UbiE